MALKAVIPRFALTRRNSQIIGTNVDLRRCDTRLVDLPEKLLGKVTRTAFTQICKQSFRNERWRIVVVVFEIELRESPDQKSR